MQQADDSPATPEAPGTPEPVQPAAGPEASASAEASASPETPVAHREPPPPLPLWPGERAAIDRAGSPDLRSRLDAAMTATRSALASIEAGGGPDDPPPASLESLEARLAEATRPLLEASLAAGASDAARSALASGLIGWGLAIVAGRLGIAARDHGRSLVPASLTDSIPGFADRHVASARAGHGVDAAFLRRSLLPVRTMGDRAWERLAASAAALEAADPAAAVPVLMLLEHARARLIRIEHWHHETCVADPGVGLRASLRIRLAARLMRPRWLAPPGIPPRPVIDDITPPRDGDGPAGAADESARSDEAA